MGAPGWMSYSEGGQQNKYFQFHFLTSGVAALVRYNLIGLILKLKDKHSLTTTSVIWYCNSFLYFKFCGSFFCLVFCFGFRY